MVILFSKRNSCAEKEIIEILKAHGGDCISDKEILDCGGAFTIVSEYKKANLKINNGIVVICDNTERFKDQQFPNGIIGICEDNNINALEVFKKSHIPVISCGMSAKNTITLSSLNSDTLLATLQRTVKNIKGDEIEPAEFKIKLKKSYSHFSVMACVAILLIKGIAPREF